MYEDTDNRDRHDAPNQGRYPPNDDFEPALKVASEHPSNRARQISEACTLASAGSIRWLVILQPWISSGKQPDYFLLTNSSATRA